MKTKIYYRLVQSRKVVKFLAVTYYCENSMCGEYFLPKESVFTKLVDFTIYEAYKCASCETIFKKCFLIIFGLDLIIQFVTDNYIKSGFFSVKTSNERGVVFKLL